MVLSIAQGACVQSLVAVIERLDPLTVSGRVAAVNGLLIEARGGLSRLAVGARAEITRFNEKPVAAEVVGFRENRALLMPFGPVEGVAPGAEIRIQPLGSAVRPTTCFSGGSSVRKLSMRHGDVGSAQPSSAGVGARRRAAGRHSNA